MKTNKFASIGISASFFIATMFFASAAFAGWTCCIPNADNTASSACGQGASAAPECPSGCCNFELKSKSDPCPAGSNCQSCGGNFVSNACSGTTNTESPVCRYPSLTPAGLVLKQGQEYDLLANAYNPGIYMISEVRAVSSAPTLVSVLPYIKNVCCGWTVGYSNPAVPFHVTALAQGVSVVKATFRASAGTTLTCSASAAVTVRGVATPLACIPGAKCVSNTGTFSVGAVVTCSMPKPTDLTLGTPSYEMSCAPFAGTVAKAKFAYTSTTGTFRAFSIATGVTKVDCKFRYCQKAASGVITCSDWGV